MFLIYRYYAIGLKHIVERQPKTGRWRSVEILRDVIGVVEMKRDKMWFAGFARSILRAVIPSNQSRLLISSTALVGCFVGSPCWAVPSVEGVDLVSSVRVDRTTFDYTYSLRVKVDASSYRNATVAVGSIATSSIVTKATVNLGSIDAGSFLRTQDTFTIRQDRTVPFDFAALKFSFSGTAIGFGTGSALNHIGKVVFLEEAGRPGHRGAFPIQSDSPEGGATLVLRADVTGNPNSVIYRFLSKTGNLLSEGFLADTKDTHVDSAAFVAKVTVPTQPFRIEIIAYNSSGEIVNWQSARLFSPSSYSLRIAPTKAFLSKGEIAAVRIKITSTNTSGVYVISLKLPSGFSGNSGPWNILLSPGVSSEVATSITAPATGDAFRAYTVGAQAFPQGLPLQTKSANLEFMVR